MSLSSIRNTAEELILDGVRYATFEDSSWRLGSTAPDWQPHLVPLGSNPQPADLLALEQKGIWLRESACVSPLAIMCCGMGSSWPGMGRELYDNFPAARAGMDRLAAAADWDLLSLMDETDLAAINQIRVQIPYLFLLEYGQWSLLSSLGLKPALISGHSLGELVALCLAGVYSPESAWYLLDTRAEHMAILESRSIQETGMLAVSADMTVISGILAEYPELHISNRNTERQFILSGPRADLAEVRRKLRRSRVPAFLLNMGLAFHNPAMRVLRDMSMRRLNGLEMHAPAVPMLSCVSGDLYPHGQPEICRTIADLDENAVDWVNAVDVMRTRHKIGLFLELGPAETLGGLVTENCPGANCMAASRKGQEVQAMRELCARLFSMGYLSGKEIAKTAARYNSMSPPRPGARPAPAKSDFPGWGTGNAGIILDLLARASGRRKEELTPNLDLRYDLALRSSSFPALVQEAEEKLGWSIDLENLFQVVTIGDLVNLFLGKDSADPEKRTGAAKPDSLSPLQKPSRFFSASFMRSVCGNEKPVTFGLVSHAGPRLKPGAVVALCIFEENLLPALWQGLACTGATIAVPDFLLDRCAPLQKAGAMVIPLGCSASPDAGELHDALSALAAKHALEGILVAPPVFSGIMEPDPLVRAAGGFQSGNGWRQWLCVLRRIHCDFIPELEPGEKRSQIIWPVQDSGEIAPSQLAEAADMLALELLYGTEACIIWSTRQAAGGNWRFCPDSPLYANLVPHKTPFAGHFSGQRDYSLYADRVLGGHGCFNPFPLPNDSERNSYIQDAWLPLGSLLLAMLDSARVLLPWLVATGISDLHLSGFPALPFGITRECAVNASLKPWLPQNGVMTRMCHVRLACRELSHNGRRGRNYLDVCDGVCVLASAGAPPDLLWPAQHATAAGCGGWPDDSLSHFYELLGFSDNWRKLAAIRRCQDLDETMEAEIILTGDCIADNNKPGYTVAAQIMDAVFQSALFALTAASGRMDPAYALAGWAVSAIGYIRFASTFSENTGALRLQLRRTWSNEVFCRFDAQVVGESGKPVLILNHLEFDRQVQQDKL